MKRFRMDGRSASEPEGCGVFHYSVPGNISRGWASPRGGDARSEIHFRTAIEITQFAELCYLWAVDCGAAAQRAKVNARAKDGPQRGEGPGGTPLVSLLPR